MSQALWKPNRTLTAYFFLTGAAGLLFIILQNIIFNGASESAVLFGLSSERLVLLGTMLLITLGLGSVGMQTLRGKFFTFAGADEETSKRTNFMLGLTLLVFLSTWVITWTPTERFGKYYYYLERLFPLVIWLTCFSAIGLFLLIAQRFGLNTKQFGAFLRQQRIFFTLTAIALLIFVMTALAVSFRVVNMRWFEEDFWYGAGVPLLAMQVLFTVGLSILLTILARRFFATKNIKRIFWVDLVIFAAIWAIAAALWAPTPLNPDFFITKPSAPNYELYPNYDAEIFDLYSQFALIGQSLNGSNGFYDRPLYSALLVYLHTLIGQNYAALMIWQAALFAIFPALGYLLGRQLHSRVGGVGLATLLTLRGINSIELGAYINTAHQKQMMTDFPAAILMLLLTVLLIRWLREPAKNWPSLAWAAGVLGLATLVRPHPLIYIPVILAVIVWVYRAKKQLWLTFGGLVLVAALAGVLPWVFGNGNDQSVADLYLQKIRNVIETRYPALHLPGGPLLPTPTKIPAAENPHFLIRTAASHPDVGDKSVLAFTLDHFLNNITTSVQILPYSPYNQTLLEIPKTSENFWRPYWNGAMSAWAWTLLPFNLILLALGLAAAWKRARWAGLVPLAMMLGYDLMNALARTSGGRYIVPVDWVVIVYYFLGIMALIEMVSALFVNPQTLLQPSPYPVPQATILLNRATWARMAGIVASFVIIGSLIPLSAAIFPRRYPTLTRSELKQQIVTKAGAQLGLTAKDWQTFLVSPQSVIVQGRILYPRQLEKDEGPKSTVYDIYIPKPYPRTLFAFIGPSGMTNATIAAIQAGNIPNASDAIILGCRENSYIQVWGILLNDDQLITRTPAAPLICPLQQPVCDNNHHCH